MKKIYSKSLRAERRDCASQSRRRSASYSNKLLIIIVMVLLLAACGSANTPTAIPTISLDENGSSPNNQSSAAADSISAAAVVVPPSEARLSFSTIGSVTSVDVKVGDKVTVGQTLVTLDTTIQEASVRQAEANLLAAQIQVNYQKRLGVDEVHIQTAEAEVARAQALALRVLADRLENGEPAPSLLPLDFRAA